MSGSVFTLDRMLVRVRLVCSDGDCADLYEAIGQLAEIDTLGCECGFGLQVLAWPEPFADVPDGGLALTPADA